MPDWNIDATKFQNQLDQLAATIAYKVQREGAPLIGSRIAIEDIERFSAICAAHI